MAAISQARLTVAPAGAGAGSGLSFLIALAALALAAVFAVLALTVLGLTVLGLAVFALTALAIRAAAALARREVGGRRRVVGADQDLGAVGQIGKARGHHAVGGRKPAGDHGVVLVLLRHHDRFGGRDVALADHIAERSGRAALDRRGRHHDRLVEGFDLQPHIDELARPELEFGVGKFGLELQRSRGRIDLVVDAFQRAGVDHRDAVIAEHVDGQRALGGGGVDAHDLLLRQAELHRDRLQLGDDDETGRIRRLDDVALVDLAQAGASRQRRDDLGIAERCRRIVDRGLVGLDQRFLLGDQGALRIGLLLRAGVGRGELLVAREIEFLVGKLRFVLRLLGDRLIVLRLVDHRIDLAEHVALLDVLAFGEIHRDQFAVDLRAHEHVVERADRADAFEIDRHILGARRRRQHRHRKSSRAPPRPPPPPPAFG